MSGPGLTPEEVKRITRGADLSAMTGLAPSSVPAGGTQASARRPNSPVNANHAGQPAQSGAPGNVYAPLIMQGRFGSSRLLSLITIVNTSSEAAGIRIGFFDRTGDPMKVPFADSAGNLGVSVGGFDDVMPAKSMTMLLTYPESDSVRVSGAQFTSEPAGAVAVAISHILLNGAFFISERDYVGPAENAQFSYAMWMSQPSKFFALNPTGSSMNVTVVARSAGGREQCRTTRVAQPRQTLQIEPEEESACMRLVAGSGTYLLEISSDVPGLVIGSYGVSSTAFSVWAPFVTR